jgi:uncharacterized protein DUF4232
VKAALIALATGCVLAAAGCARPTTGTASGPPAVTSTSAGTTTDTADTAGTAGTTTGTAGTTTSPTTTSAPAPSTSTGPTPARTGTRCHTPDLTGALSELDAAAGHRYARLVLTNVSSRVCTVYGYGGLQLATASRQPLPTIQRRDPMHPPRLVRLAPGGKASSVLSWGAVPSGSEPVTGPCEPQPSLLLVIPPDETTQLAVPWRFGSVCQHGAITQWAYAAGIVRP